MKNNSAISGKVKILAVALILVILGMYITISYTPPSSSRRPVMTPLLLRSR